MNTSTEAVLLAEGYAIASVSSDEAVSTLQLPIFLTDKDVGKSPASDSVLPAF